MADLGPVIRKVTKNPERPNLAIQDSLTITAEVSASGEAVAQVNLIYRRGFLAESALEMFDNGTGPDEFAGDGVYSAGLSLAGLQTGEMIRWRVESRDVNGSLLRILSFLMNLILPSITGQLPLIPLLNLISRCWSGFWKTLMLPIIELGRELP